MISTLNNSVILRTAIILWFCFGVFGNTYAQSSLALSVSPTKVDLTTQPGELWQSSIRIINSNSFPLTVYGSMVNFAAQGESGQGTFIPVVPEETQGATLAEWITLETESITIQPGASAEYPFTVTVPEDANPGSHFAALQVSTQPPDAGNGESGLQTAQVVSSLFFIRVSGDILEEGVIRSFQATDSLSATPKTDIELRFENNGNVHLQPQGTIVIRNMWGTERGTIPVNFNTSFGNSLPDTIRLYEFSWQGSQSLFDFGLYSAEAVLVYGQEERKFINQKTYFWVIPLAAIVITLSILLSIAGFLYWMVRSYVRRMFALAGIDPSTITARARSKQVTSHVITGRTQLSWKRVIAPATTAVSDLQKHLRSGGQLHRQLPELWLFIKEYRMVWLALLGLIASIIFIALLVGYVRDTGTPFVSTIGTADSAITYDSEVLAYIEQTGQPLPTQVAPDTTALEVVNASGEVGFAASLAEKVPNEFTVISLSTDTTSRNRTVITFPPELQAAALRLSDALGGVLVSADADAEQITLIVGKVNHTQ